MANYHFVGVGAVKRTGTTRLNHDGAAANRSASRYSLSPSARIEKSPAKAGDTIAVDFDRDGADFLSSARSRGPYNGPTSRSLNNVYESYQRLNPRSDKACSPSGSSAIVSDGRGETMEAPDEDDVRTENYQLADPMASKAKAKASASRRARSAVKGRK